MRRPQQRDLAFTAMGAESGAPLPAALCPPSEAPVASCLGKRALQERNILRASSTVIKFKFGAYST